VFVAGGPSAPFILPIVALANRYGPARTASGNAAAAPPTSVMPTAGRRGPVRGPAASIAFEARGCDEVGPHVAFGLARARQVIFPRFLIASVLCLTAAQTSRRQSSRSYHAARRGKEAA
jgi:hypothetical protein